MHGGLLLLHTFPQLLYGVLAGPLTRHGHRRDELQQQAIIGCWHPMLAAKTHDLTIPKRIAFPSCRPSTGVGGRQAKSLQKVDDGVTIRLGMRNRDTVTTTCEGNQ